MKYRWTTALSADACLRRLRDQSLRPRRFEISWRMPSMETFYCTLSERRFKLFALLPDSWFNSMIPFFFGTVEDTPEGSVVRGRLGVHSFIAGFMGCYLAIVLGMAGFLAWAAFKSDGTSSVFPALVGVLGCVLLAAAGIGVFVAGIMAGQAQKEAILRFVDMKLEATRTVVKETT